MQAMSQSPPPTVECGTGHFRAQQIYPFIVHADARGLDTFEISLELRLGGIGTAEQQQPGARLARQGKRASAVMPFAAAGNADDVGGGEAEAVRLIERQHGEEGASANTAPVIVHLAIARRRGSHLPWQSVGVLPGHGSHMSGVPEARHGGCGRRLGASAGLNERKTGERRSRLTAVASSKEISVELAVARQEHSGSGGAGGSQSVLDRADTRIFGGGQDGPRFLRGRARGSLKPAIRPNSGTNARTQGAIPGGH